ncbi:MAG: type II toxin-antitoxin system RelE/ParE family toxin [Alphaproteobacteria bacterium]|nr:type II toxin-antitoxin system RelE/ParE family toxin [Alphaproteobacteria bacterium]
MPRSFKLAPAAKTDLADIARYTADKWGKKQALKYASLLDQWFQKIAEGKDISKAILPHNESVRVCRCEHHYVFYLRQEKGQVILAVLHEKMDLIERLKERLPQ